MAYNVLEIAKHLLRKAKCNGEEEYEMLTNLKLQKLLYYEQGYHLAYFGKPLFEAPIEAWMYGPVVPEVYQAYQDYKGNGIPAPDGEFTFEDNTEAELFDEVYEVYSAFSASKLIEMTHSESPWINAQKGVGCVIPNDAIQSYFKTKLQ